MSVVRYFPVQIMNVALKDIIRGAFAVPANSSYALKLASQIGSGTLAGTLSLWIVYPLDLVATRLMSDVGQPRKFKGNLDCCAAIVAQVLLLHLCQKLIFLLFSRMAYLDSTRASLYRCLASLSIEEFILAAMMA